MSTQPSQLTSAPLPDICRNRHGGEENSELANLRVHERKKADRERIKAFAGIKGDYGITLHEVHRELQMPIQTASARLSEMKTVVDLVKNGEKRGHAAVLIIPKGQMSFLS